MSANSCRCEFGLCYPIPAFLFVERGFWWNINKHWCLWGFTHSPFRGRCVFCRINFILASHLAWDQIRVDFILAVDSFGSTLRTFAPSRRAALFCVWDTRQTICRAHTLAENVAALKTRRRFLLSIVVRLCLLSPMGGLHY